jgi:phage-related protein
VQTAADVLADLILCGLKVLMSIPLSFKTSFTHLAKVALDTFAQGLIQFRNNCVDFRITEVLFRYYFNTRTIHNEESSLNVDRLKGSI